MSLANKIHNTEINHEIDKYLESINTLFADTSKDELIKKFFSVEFTRFFNYYQKSRIQNVTETRGSDSDGGGRGYSSNANDTRYFINVGRKDGYDWMKLKDFLKEVLELGRDDVFKVDVKESFSFFTTEKTLQEKVLAFFTDFKHEGRFVNVEVSEDKGRSTSRNKRRSGGSSFGGRKRDDGSKNERRSSGARKDRSGNTGNRRSRRSDSDSKPRRSESKNDSGIERPRRSRR